jgi:hypothetical protein
MLTHNFRWSHAAGNQVVPSPWQATPPVTDDRAFATRAILGEEQWMADSIKRRDIIALNAVSTACLSVAGVAAWRRRPLPMAVAIAGSMAVILMTWRSYAELYDPRLIHREYR